MQESTTLRAGHVQGAYFRAYARHIRRPGGVNLRPRLLLRLSLAMLPMTRARSGIGEVMCLFNVFVMAMLAVCPPPSAIYWNFAVAKVLRETPSSDGAGGRRVAPRTLSCPCMKQLLPTTMSQGTL